MRSLREIQDEVLKVRAVPTDVSTWYLLMTVEERVRNLLSDVIQTYEYHVDGVLYSVGVSGMPITVALPRSAQRVTYVDVVGTTQGATARRAVRNVRHTPTPATNLLALDDAVNTWSITTPLYFLEIGYQQSSRDIVVPKDVIMVGASANSAGGWLASDGGGIYVSGGTPVDRWTAPGFLEVVHPSSDTDAREVIHYEKALPTGFTGLTRGIEGQPQVWSQGSKVSYCVPAPNRAIPTWTRALQGGLYDALVADRSFYDKYNAIASEQASPPERLIGLSRTFEDKADRAFRRGRQLPRPTRARIRKLRR